MSAHKRRQSHAFTRDSGSSCLSWYDALVAAALRLDDHHPAHAEAVGDHAEALGEERLAERHAHFSTIRERFEHAVGVGFVLGIDGQREALEFRLALRAAVGCHHWGIADAKTRMHDLVLAAGGNHAGRRRLRAFLVAHHHLDLGAKRLLVEVERFLAAAVEEQVRCHWHASLLSVFDVETTGVQAACARLSAARSILRICNIDRMTRCDFSEFSSMSICGSAVGMTCHERPNLSLSQPQGPSSPPSASLVQKKSISSCVSQ